MLLAVSGLNTWLHWRHGLVLPLAATAADGGDLNLAGSGQRSRGTIVDQDTSSSPPLNPTALRAVYGVDRIATEQERSVNPTWRGRRSIACVSHPMTRPPSCTPRWQCHDLPPTCGTNFACGSRPCGPGVRRTGMRATSLLNLQRLNAKKVLYRLYAQRVASRRRLPLDPAWDAQHRSKPFKPRNPGTGAAGHTKPNSP